TEARWNVVNQSMIGRAWPKPSAVKGVKFNSFGSCVTVGSATGESVASQAPANPTCDAGTLVANASD
ncbi:MAG: hypothetical protein ACJAQ9_003068, partial [Ilumatobacter sp.]